MSIACLFEWPLVTPAQLEQLEASLDWPRHLGNERWAYEASPQGGRLVVIDVWETRAALDLFLETCFEQMLLSAGLPKPSIKSWKINEGEAGGYPVQLGGNDQTHTGDQPGSRSN